MWGHKDPNADDMAAGLSPDGREDRAMSFKAKYAGTCALCNGAIKVGESISSARHFGGRGYRHEGCGSTRRRATKADMEVARGEADVAKWRADLAFGGDDYAAAEELARDLRDPDPYY